VITFWRGYHAVKYMVGHTTIAVTA